MTSEESQLSPGLMGKCYWQCFTHLRCPREGTDPDEDTEDRTRKKQSVAWLGWHKKGVAEMLAASDHRGIPSNLLLEAVSSSTSGQYGFAWPSLKVL